MILPAGPPTSNDGLTFTAPSMSPRIARRRPRSKRGGLECQTLLMATARRVRSPHASAKLFGVLRSVAPRRVFLVRSAGSPSTQSPSPVQGGCQWPPPSGSPERPAGRQHSASDAGLRSAWPTLHGASARWSEGRQPRAGNAGLRSAKPTLHGALPGRCMLHILPVALTQPWPWRPPYLMSRGAPLTKPLAGRRRCEKE